MHGALSEMESFDEPWDLPRRGKAEQHAVQDYGGAVTRLEIYAAVAGRNLLKRVCLVDHFIGRLAERVGPRSKAFSYGSAGYR
jgi:hypothetical protein